MIRLSHLRTVGWINLSPWLIRQRSRTRERKFDSTSLYLETFRIRLSNHSFPALYSKIKNKYLQFHDSYYTYLSTKLLALCLDSLQFLLQEGRRGSWTRKFEGCRWVLYIARMNRLSCFISWSGARSRKYRAAAAVADCTIMQPGWIPPHYNMNLDRLGHVRPLCVCVCGPPLGSPSFFLSLFPPFPSSFSFIFDFVPVAHHCTAKKDGNSLSSYEILRV